MDTALLEAKAALGIETTVNLLCDPSYLGYLASTKKKKVHGYVAKMFGVSHVMFDTTQCIMKHLKNCGSADETFKKLEQKVSGFVCTHFKTALEPESCLLDVINGEHAEPFILASLDEEICRKMQERTGVHVLTVINGKMTLMVPSLPQLERMKQQRIERVEARKKIELEKRMAFEAYLKEEERKQKEAKAGETSSKKGKAKNKQDKALLETKAALGIETKVRLLCDPSYFRYLASIVEDAQDLLYTLPEKKNVHGDVTKMFGVNHVTLDTTKCVMKHLKECGSADGNAHVVECAQMVRCFVCTHLKTALEPESCLQYVIHMERAEPYILASVDEESYRKMQERTGVPVLTVINGKKTVIVPSLPQLERIKQQRIEEVALQKKIEFEKRMDFVAYLKEEEQKQKEAKAGETSSKKGKAKKKQ